MNLNVWITPDDANLNPDDGGLYVYDKQPPDTWNFAQTNEYASNIKKFLDEEPKANKINVKYTLDLAKKAKVEGVSQFVFMSSIAVYDSSTGEINEMTKKLLFLLLASISLPTAVSAEKMTEKEKREFIV